MGVTPQPQTVVPAPAGTSTPTETLRTLPVKWEKRDRMGHFGTKWNKMGQNGTKWNTPKPAKIPPLQLQNEAK